jgi:TonB family protein
MRHEFTSFPVQHKDYGKQTLLPEPLDELFPMKFRLISGISLYLAFLSQFALSPLLRADESPLTSLGGLPKPTIPSAFGTNSGPTNAVDANGIRHRGVDYPRKRAPWLHDDVIKAVAPDYPDRDRILRHEGAGLFQLMLDLKTGFVTKVAVIKSTGFPALDASAVTSFRQWRWKAGKWKEIEITIGFSTALHSVGRFAVISYPALPRRSVLLAPAKR